MRDCIRECVCVSVSESSGDGAMGTNELILGEKKLGIVLCNSKLVFIVLWLMSRQKDDFRNTKAVEFSYAEKLCSESFATVFYAPCNSPTRNVSPRDRDSCAI